MPNNLRSVNPKLILLSGIQSNDTIRSIYVDNSTPNQEIDHIPKRGQLIGRTTDNVYRQVIIDSSGHAFCLSDIG